MYVKNYMYDARMCYFCVSFCHLQCLYYECRKKSHRQKVTIYILYEIVIWYAHACIHRRNIPKLYLFENGHIAASICICMYKYILEKNANIYFVCQYGNEHILT